MPVFVRDEVRVLFVHVPKTGGSAIEDAFAADGWEVHLLERTSRRRPPNQLMVCSPQHMHAELLRRNLRLGLIDHSFTVVREPVARFRSEFAWRHRTEQATHDAGAVEAWAERAMERYAADPYVLDNHLRPQQEFPLPETSVHRYEDGLQGAVDAVYAAIGAGTPPTIPAAPGGEGAGSRAVPTSLGLIDRIVGVYAGDFERFGYPVPSGAGGDSSGNS
jgi:hypothetical protein